jgi:hypothetical protein
MGELVRRIKEPLNQIKEKVSAMEAEISKFSDELFTGDGKMDKMMKYLFVATLVYVVYKLLKK